MDRFEDYTLRPTPEAPRTPSPTFDLRSIHTCAGSGTPCRCQDRVKHILVHLSKYESDDAIHWTMMLWHAIMSRHCLQESNDAEKGRLWRTTRRPAALQASPRLGCIRIPCHPGLLLLSCQVLARTEHAI